MSRLVFIFTALLIVYAVSVSAAQEADEVEVRSGAMSGYSDVQQFIRDISKRNKLDPKVVTRAFDNAKFDASVIALMNKPAEKHSWSHYSGSLLSRERISGGVSYMKTYATSLKKAETAYGVPPHVVTAIIGVETFYGTAPLRRNAVVSIGTIAFEYPRRAEYFKSELEKLFVLAHKEGADPLTYMGSYAGAIGIAQFMPSNIITYGRDGDNDSHVDIVRSHADAIHSVAYYIERHGWQKGKDTTVLVSLRKTLPESAFSRSPCDTKNRKTVKILREMGVVFDKSYPDNARGILSGVDDGEDAYVPVVFFENACAIHKYNSSLKYTVAISTLAEKLRQERNK